MQDPEIIIRRYLDEHEGNTKASLQDVLASFELEDPTAVQLADIAFTLESVGVRSDPPLTEVSPDGRLTLYVDGPEGGEEPEAQEPVAPVAPELFELEEPEAVEPKTDEPAEPEALEPA